MPIEGSKKIELDGREVFLPSDLVELEEIVAAGLQLQHEMTDTKKKLDGLKERALAIAVRHRFSKKTVTLTAPRAGAVKVTWSTQTLVDDEGARELEKEIARNVFEGLFNRTVTYSPTPGLSGFLKTPQTTDLEALKLRVAKVVEFKARTPSVKFFDSAEPVGAAGDDE
jgi:hypothetical protein